MIRAYFIFESYVEDLLEGLDLIRAVKLAVLLLYEPKGMAIYRLRNTTTGTVHEDNIGWTEGNGQQSRNPTTQKANWYIG